MGSKTARRVDNDPTGQRIEARRRTVQLNLLLVFDVIRALHRSDATLAVLAGLLRAQHHARLIGGLALILELRQRADVVKLVPLVVHGLELSRLGRRGGGL